MFYQVGGSLKNDNPTYVERKADQKLYLALKRADFCYVLNARQMGKSSLLVRTRSRLQHEGFKCATIDLTHIGSANLTPTQWYKGLISDLCRGFKLTGKFDLKAWWQQLEDISLIQRLDQFFSDVLLVRLKSENIVIFIDEIDSILGLPFSVDDFFAFIRFCYNQRASNPEYNRLTFAIFGVAAPSDLIQDKKRTPFNIGCAIELEGFNLDEIQPLAKGLKVINADIDAVLKEVLYWTGGQPFLTQKLCSILASLSKNYGNEPLIIPKCQEAAWVDDIVKSQIIENWEVQDEPEHFRTIRDRIERNNQQAAHILGLYQQVLEEQEIAKDDSKAQIELILSGLVIQNQGKITVKNNIYKKIFNSPWVKQKLANLRPYSQTFEAWIDSQKKDYSRLLRGQALEDARLWASGKSLTELDYQFLAASWEIEQQETQLKLKAEKAQAIQAKLVQEKKASQLQRIVLGVISAALAIAILSGAITYNQYRKASESEIIALSSSSDGNFDSLRHLDALVQGIKAKAKVNALGGVSPEITTQVDTTLRQAIYGADEFNRLVGHQGGVLGVAISPDGQTIATSSTDQTVKLWQMDGSLLRTLKHQSTVYRVKFSPDGKMIATANLDNTVKLWGVDGKLLTTMKGHEAAVWDVAFSPDGKTVVSASGDKTLKLWTVKGQLLTTLSGHQQAIWGVAFSENGKLIASASFDGSIKLWLVDGSLVKTIQVKNNLVYGVTFSPDSQMLASCHDDGMLRLWSLDGTLIKTLEGHKGLVERVAFSRDGSYIASVGNDKTVKIWKRDGTLVKTLAGHSGKTFDVAFTPDSNRVASASFDTTVKLWQLKNDLLRPVTAKTNGTWDISYSPDSNLIALADNNAEIKLFKNDGNLQKQFIGSDLGVLGVSFSPDGQLIASGRRDQTIKLFRVDGSLVLSWKAHDAAVWRVAFSSDGQMIASTSDDNTVKLWKLDGTLINTLKGHTSRAYQVVFSPDAQRLASVSEDGMLIIWERNGKIFKKILAHNNACWGLAMSPDGKILATASLDGTIKLWDWNGALLRTLTSKSKGFPSVKFSPDGQLLASGSVDNMVTIWKVDGTELMTLLAHKGIVWSVAFSPDGKQLVSASDEPSVFLWDLEKILKLDDLGYACNWLKDYFKTNPEVKRDDLSLCVQFKTPSKGINCLFVLNFFNRG